MYTKSVIGETIIGILGAEEQAAKLRRDAQASCNRIENKINIEVENIRAEHARQLNEKIKDLAAVPEIGESDTPQITVPKANINAAVKYIIANLLRGSL